MEQQELNRVKEMLDSPLLYKKDVSVILKDVYKVKDARARQIYSVMRKNYEEDFKKKNLVVFATSTPNKYVFDFLADLGITKADILRKLKGDNQDAVNR